MICLKRSEKLCLLNFNKVYKTELFRRDFFNAANRVALLQKVLQSYLDKLLGAVVFSCVGLHKAECEFKLLYGKC